MAGRPLSDFIAEVKSGGLARTNRFSVRIPGAATFVNMFCEQVTLPGMSYGTKGMRTFGETREMVYERLFEPITLNFFVDSDMFVKYFFDKWMRGIVDPVTRISQYYSQYIKDIDVLVQDLVNNDVYKVTLHEAYPKSMGQVQLDYNSKDVMKLSVTFVYKYHTNEWITNEKKNEDQSMLLPNEATPDSNVIEYDNAQLDINAFFEPLDITIGEGPGIGGA